MSTFRRKRNDRIIDNLKRHLEQEFSIKAEKLTGYEQRYYI